MLWVALMLLSGPLDRAEPRPFAVAEMDGEPITDVRVAPPAASTQRFLSGRCEALLHRVSPSSPSSTVTRSTAFGASSPAGQPKVRMYHLLERTIDGCRVPVIAIDHLPEADRAIGRTFGGSIHPR